jgi:HTH-type transcriptional regulator, sugar sensing transcriptional regulator
MTGYEVAKQSGVPRAKVYGALESLQKKGIAHTSVEGERTRYHPLPQATLLRRHLERAARAVAELEPLLDEAARPEADAPLVTVRGYEAVLTRAREVAESARESVFVSGYPDELVRLAPPLRAAEERGARVWCLVYGDAELGLGQVYCHNVIETRGRLRAYHPTLIAVADHKESLMAEIAPGGRVTGLWTRNMGVTMVAAEYVKHDIFLVELTRRFGHLVDHRALRDLQKMWFY